MQTDWLIDFRTLAETRNFSRAARLRHITQPAFSRRIRSLEDWAEATLVDRSCHPTQLTPAGDLLLARVPGLIASIQRTHAMLRSHTPSSHDTLAFAASPWLASGFFPGWITGLSDALNPTSTRMTVLEPRAGLQHLVDGHCDLLLVHACDDLPLNCRHWSTALPCNSVDSNFTLAASMGPSSPAMNCEMHQSVNTRSEVVSAASCASTNCVFWKSAMVPPKAFRSRV